MYIPVVYKYALLKTEMLFKGFYKEISGVLNESSNYFSTAIN